MMFKNKNGIYMKKEKGLHLRKVSTTTTGFWNAVTTYKLLNPVFPNCKSLHRRDVKPSTADHELDLLFTFLLIILTFQLF
ncbi:hypothetical protein evm_012272 [Chilo suppressalis]|nr:hypothetical protein evm_012272 [Chilo suppressalis]